MNRSKLNFTIDIAMLIVMLGLVWTGILIWAVLPAGSRGGRGLILWGLNRHEFGDIHMGLGIALLLLSGLHLWLHWGWFACKLTNMIKTTNSQNVQKRKIHAMIIVFVILVLTIASLFLAKTQVTSGPDSHSGRYRQQRGKQIQENYE
jgi:hypothetical protein